MNYMINVNKIRSNFLPHELKLDPRLAVSVVILPFQFRWKIKIAIISKQYNLRYMKLINVYLNVFFY